MSQTAFYKGSSFYHLQDTDFIQQIKKNVVVEEDAGKVIEEEQSDGLDMDEGMLMAGLSIFENGF